jgi:hypothetical protein
VESWHDAISANHRPWIDVGAHDGSRRLCVEERIGVFVSIDIWSDINVHIERSGECPATPDRFASIEDRDRNDRRQGS